MGKVPDPSDITVVKWREACWKLLTYAGLSIYGVFVLAGEEWVTDTSKLWAGWPSQHHSCAPLPVTSRRRRKQPPLRAASAPPALTLAAHVQVSASVVVRSRVWALWLRCGRETRARLARHRSEALAAEPGES